MKATAIAPSNIALVKYWGRRNDRLVLPYNGSISVSLNDLFTRTTVEFSSDFKEDIVVINGEVAEGEKLSRVINFVNMIRDIYSIDDHVKIVSENNFPTSAGLASSASGFAALTLACSKALGLNLSDKEISILARRSGSGSASRSIFGGFVEWHRGNRDDGTDSYSEQIVDEKYWRDFRVIVSIVAKSEKKISSARGMKYTVETSPFYKGWINSIDNDLKRIRSGILDRDIELVGSVAEHNCLKMHSLMLSTVPPLIYWVPETLQVIHTIHKLRDDGLACYFTIDAGPNVKVICSKNDVKEIKDVLTDRCSIEDIIVTKPGKGARITNSHLF